MTILGIDTVTVAASVGISRDGNILSEFTEFHARGHAHSLPAMVEHSLRHAGVGIDALNGIAVSIGPGSFTGLRVGLGFAKGFAFARGSRVAGIPTLEGLALAAPAGALLIATCLDARKGEVYLAIYERQGRQMIERLCPTACTPGEAAAAIGDVIGSVGAALVGDAAERYPEAFAGLVARGVEILPFSVVHPRGGLVAVLGERALKCGEGVAPQDLLPSYLRPSEPERRRQRASLTMEKTL